MATPSMRTSANPGRSARHPVIEDVRGGVSPMRRSANLVRSRHNSEAENARIARASSSSAQISADLARSRHEQELEDAMIAAALMEQELREADEADAIGITRTSS